MFADKILQLLGENPDYIYSVDKWPVVFTKLFFYSLPLIFALLIIIPFVLLWHKKKKFNWRNIGIALLQSAGLVVLGVVALFFLFSFMLGQVFQAVNGI